MVRLLEIVTEVILEQPKNACETIAVTLGQFIEVNEEHPKKA